MIQQNDFVFNEYIFIYSGPVFFSDTLYSKCHRRIFLSSDWTIHITCHSNNKNINNRSIIKHLLIDRSPMCACAAIDKFKGRICLLGLLSNRDVV